MFAFDRNTIEVSKYCFVAFDPNTINSRPETHCNSQRIFIPCCSAGRPPQRANFAVHCPPIPGYFVCPSHEMHIGIHGALSSGIQLEYHSTAKYNWMSVTLRYITPVTRGAIGCEDDGGYVLPNALSSSAISSQRRQRGAMMRGSLLQQQWQVQLLQLLRMMMMMVVVVV